MGNLGQWLSANPKFVMDISAASTSNVIPSTKPTMEKAVSSKTTLEVKKPEKNPILTSATKDAASTGASSIESVKEEKLQTSSKKLAPFENSSNVS